MKPILTFLSIVFSILVEIELAADSILVEIELAADLIFCLIGLNSFAKSAAVIPGCAGCRAWNNFGTHVGSCYFS